MFTPLWLILRLVRHDPLALGARARRRDVWRPVPRGRRSCTGGRSPTSACPGPCAAATASRCRACARRSAWSCCSSCSTSASAPRSTGSRDLGGGEAAKTNSGWRRQNVPAGAGEPWRVPLGDEINQVWDTKRYDPYLGWTMPDFHGPLRERRATACAAPTSRAPAATGRPLSGLLLRRLDDVRLFQRDEHTIPSEFARLARGRRHPRAGRQLRAARLRQLAGGAASSSSSSRGRARPTWPCSTTASTSCSASSQLGPHSRADTPRGAAGRRAARPGQRGRAPGDAKKSWPRAAYDAWARRQPVHRLGSGLGLWSQGDASGGAARDARSGPATRPRRPGGAARYAASIYGARRGPRPAAAPAATASRRAFFWQPTIYSKRVVPGEEDAARLAGHRRGRLARRRPRRARSRLGARGRRPQRLRSTAARKPVMYDFVHTNELGARVVAAGALRSACGPSCCDCGGTRP